MTMRPITNDQAPEPFGAYSPAARIGNLVQVSGQIGLIERPPDLPQVMLIDRRSKLSTTSARCSRRPI